MASEETICYRYGCVILCEVKVITTTGGEAYRHSARRGVETGERMEYHTHNKYDDESRK